MLTCWSKNTYVLHSCAELCSQEKSTMIYGSQFDTPDGAPTPNILRSNWDFTLGRPPWLTYFHHRQQHVYHLFIVLTTWETTLLISKKSCNINLYLHWFSSPVIINFNKDSFDVSLFLHHSSIVRLIQHWFFISSCILNMSLVCRIQGLINIIIVVC